MNRFFMLALMAVVSLSGCAAVTTMDRSGFYNEATGKYYAVNTVTVRDRTGTDMHHVMVMDDQDKLFSHATGSGRGIVAGMTDGLAGSVVQAGGMVGAAALWPSNNYSGGNAFSEQSQDQTAVGGAGGHAIAGAASISAASARATNVTRVTNTNLNTNRTTIFPRPCR